MMDVDTARKRWIAERPKYVEFANLVSSRLQKALKPIGLWFDVSARAKEVDSLVKKLIKKPKHDYDSLPDKVGARIVVRFRADIPHVLDVIEKTLHCDVVDDKRTGLGIDRVGYQSVHLDGVRLQKDDPDHGTFPGNTFWLELQVRTLAQHLWSEISHDTVYKNDDAVAGLPEDIKRRVNLMAGQIEVADREFDRLNRELPADEGMQLLKVLERHYFTLSSRRPDAELSLQVLRSLAPLYNESTGEIVQRLDRFIKEQHPTLEAIYEQAAEGEPAYITAFLFQPEVLMIYERLLNDPIAIRKGWNLRYPESELERIANLFGLALD
jgi:ppGpp synthetase/RelA/SpoT-type nucleotidyltranferase